MDNVCLKNFCTYGVGGKGKRVVRVFDVEGLERVMAEARGGGVTGGNRMIVIGRGSKVLFSDEGVDGIVVVMSGERVEFISAKKPLSDSSENLQVANKDSMSIPNGSVMESQRCGEGEVFCLEGLMSCADNTIKGYSITHSIMFEGCSITHNVEKPMVYADSGVFLPKLARECARRGFGGLEWAVGIPGSVGGAVWMNAGAHGGDVAGVCEWVDVWRDGEVVRVQGGDCGFKYRESGFKGGDVVLGACFRLEAGGRGEIEERMRMYSEKRRVAQPVGRSCGSVFKAVLVRVDGSDERIVVPAWEFIDACGFRGMRIGGAEVSKKHANFIMNVGEDGECKSEDIKELIRLIKAEVYLRFGVRLEEEVVYV